MSKPGSKTANYETSIAGWSFALSDALDNYGHNGRRVFREAGIDLEAVTSPAQRLPVDSVQQVWRFAEQNTDEYFGARVSEYITPASLHALGFGLLCSSTLQEFFERYIRYRCVLSHMHFCELVMDGERCWLSLVDERRVKSEITHDAAIGLLLRMTKSLYGPEFFLEEVRITRTLPVEAIGRLQEFYGATIVAGADAYALELDPEALQHPLRFANPDLAAQQDTIVERYIAEHGLISEYMLRVRTYIQELLVTGVPSIEAVAEKLNVTVRTLQRRLSDENSSYNQLLDTVRKQLALEYAREPDRNATDIALSLGFNDSGSFGRSFKRWTGQSFTSYRGTRDER